MLLAQIQQRGCKEDFQPDAALMKDGQVGICLLLMWYAPPQRSTQPLVQAAMCQDVTQQVTNSSLGTWQNQLAGTPVNYDICAVVQQNHVAKVCWPSSSGCFVNVENKSSV